MDGIAFDKIVGFDDLGGEDEFKTLTLTRRLVETGCIKGKTRKERGEMKITRKARGRAASSDSN